MSGILSLSFTVCGTVCCLGLSVEAVQCLHRVVEQLPVDLPLELCQVPRLEPHPTALGVVTGYEYFPTVCLNVIVVIYHTKIK